MEGGTMSDSVGTRRTVRARDQNPISPLAGKPAPKEQYAHANGVRVIGDVPFFVSPDSSDVWANPEFFLLDERRRPRFVAGVPPDTSVLRDSYGVIRFTTGTPFVPRGTGGASIGFALCLVM